MWALVSITCATFVLPALAFARGAAPAPVPAPVPAPATVARAVAAIAADYARLLRVHVDAAFVDYEGLRAHDRARLGSVLDRMAAIDDTQLPAARRLAFRIDQYNATVLAAVCDRYRGSYTVAESGYALFHAPLVRRKSGRMSLDTLEAKLIRAEFKDPRVHAALCCAARSCPALAANAYLAMPLDSVLDANMRRFVLDTDRNRIDAASKRLVLSRLFDWYAADFGGAAVVPATIERWSGVKVRGYAVTFRDYDWSLNDDAPNRR